MSVALACASLNGPVWAEAYNWDRVVIGGGGYLYNIVEDPTQAGGYYAVGDNTNVWRWTPNATKLVPLMDSLRSYDFEPGGMQGGGGLAVDPNNGNTVYAAFGISYDAWRGINPQMGIYKSTDKGANWTATPILNIPIAGNMGGNTMAVDPNNSSVVYYGSAVWRNYNNNGNTRNGGLYRTINAGTSWATVASVPKGTEWVTPSDGSTHWYTGASPGVDAVLIDSRQGTVSGSGIGVSGNVSKVVYVVVRSNDPDARYVYNDSYREAAFAGGVFRSTDGGATFSLLNQTGAPGIVRNITEGPGNSIYATAKNGVFKFNGDTNTWSQLAGTNGYDFMAIDADPADLTNRIVAVGTPYPTGGDTSSTFWVTTNGGTNWDKKNWGYGNGTAANYNNDGTFMRRDNTSFSLLGTSAVMFDRSSTASGKTPRLIEADAFGAWKTEDIYATQASTKWDFVKGYEGTIVRAAVSVPNPSTGNAILFTGGSDIGGFRHTSLTSVASRYPGANSIELTGIAVGESNSNNSSNNSIVVTTGGVYTSSNGGQSFTTSSLPSGLSSDGAGPARIAMSATNRDRAVYVGNGAKPFYTTNAFTGGTNISWTQTSSTFDANPINDANLYLSHNLLAADKVLGERFYVLSGSYLYVSTDWGQTWTKKTGTTFPTDWGFYRDLVATPGVSNAGKDLWVNSGGQGLWHSTDGGDNFTKLSNVKNARGFGWGANKPGVNNPTVFIAGKVTIGGSDVEGIFRSTDMGATWEQISDSTHKYPSIRFLEGDRNVYGRVYISNGSGLAYGAPANSAGPNLVSNSSFDAEAYDTQTPSGWSEWNHSNASYSEAYGGSKSGSRHGTHWSNSAYEVSTYQAKTGLTNGLYTMKAWVKGNGTLASGEYAGMFVKNYGGSQRWVDVPRTSTYTQIELKDINVTNGNAEIGFYSKVGANKWIYFDDVEFFKQ